MTIVSVLRTTQLLPVSSVDTNYKSYYNNKCYYISSKLKVSARLSDEHLQGQRLEEKAD